MERLRSDVLFRRFSGESYVSEMSYEVLIVASRISYRGGHLDELRLFSVLVKESPRRCSKLQINCI